MQEYTQEYTLVRGRGRALQPEDKYLGLRCQIVQECPTGAVQVRVDTHWDSLGEFDTVDLECLEAIPC